MCVLKKFGSLVGSVVGGGRSWHQHREGVVVGECRGLRRIHEMIVAGAGAGVGIERRIRVDAADADVAEVADATVSTTLVEGTPKGRILVVAQQLLRVAE